MHRLPVRSTALTALLVIGFAATAQAPATLKSAYHGDFVIGAAINAAQITGEDARGDAILQAQFNSISPENCLKWESVHPQPDKYDFTIPDQYVLSARKITCSSWATIWCGITRCRLGFSRR